MPLGISSAPTFFFLGLESQDGCDKFRLIQFLPYEFRMGNKPGSGLPICIVVYYLMKTMQSPSQNELLCDYDTRSRKQVQQSSENRGSLQRRYNLFQYLSAPAIAYQSFRIQNGGLD